MSGSVFLSRLSDVIGWCYFIAWSVSFWPQAVLNARRRRVTGLSFEFLAYNLTGFLFYSAYSTVKFFASTGCPQTVEVNDLAFGYHAVLLTAVTIVQCLLYKTRRQRVHPAHAAVVAALWLLTLYTLVLCFLTPVPLMPRCEQRTDSSGESHSVQLTGFTLVDWLGYCKAFISLVKYSPQAWLNWRRQSTVGWSISNILLDLTGGLLSFTQQCLDSINAGDATPIVGNVPKLLLALESVAFDVLFIVQHYCLYRGKGTPADDEDGQDEDDDEEEQVEGGGEQTPAGEAADEDEPAREGQQQHRAAGGLAKERARGGRKKPVRLLAGEDADGWLRQQLVGEGGRGRAAQAGEAADGDGGPYYRAADGGADDELDYQPGFALPASRRVNEGFGMMHVPADAASHLQR